ncbi:heterokaryon incompatibility domain-containing protein [Trichoderma afarasin]
MGDLDRFSDASSVFIPQPCIANVSAKKLGYQYQPFQDNASIRIFTLAPGKPSEPLRGTLEAIRIDEIGSYEAISYVWKEDGPPNCKYEIVINTDDNEERLLELTEGGNIFAALRRIRLPDRGRRIWADQICINQDDLDERSQQVQFMNRIYKDASHVLVWLGLDSNGEAISAFSLIHNLHQTLQNAGGESYARLADGLEQEVKNSKNALHSLTSRKWFKRGWIVQEIGTAAPATMFWGDAEIDWKILHGVCESLTDYHHLRKELNINTSDIKFLFQRFIEPDVTSHHANRFNFIYELHRARSLNFTNDRDRIFAFLGHYSLTSAYSQNNPLASITSNYTMSVEQVYIDLAKRSLRGSQGDSALITLAAVQHLVGRLPSRDDPILAHNGLPSWVPDWRTYQGFILSEPINPHRAHGSSKPKLEIGDDSALLRIHGVYVDTIEACSPPLKNKDFHGKSRMTELLWNEICQKKSFNLDDRYRNSQEGAFFAFMQTLGNGCVQIAGREGIPYNEIPASRWLEQAAMYLVGALGDSGIVSLEIRTLADEAKCKHEKEEWSRSANGASKNRIFARTTSGYYVLGPAVMEKGDVVCVLFGGKLPFCLRPIGERYLLVGECYAHGLMEGEALDMMDYGECSEKEFEIV